MKTNAAIGNLFSLLLQNVAWPNVGDAGGLRPSSVTGRLCFSLHTAWPGNTGSQNTNEAAYAGYARVGVGRANTQFGVATPQADNTNQVNFPQCTAGSEVELFVGIGTDLTGAGHLLYAGPITQEFFGCVGVVAGNAITVPNSLFAPDDRIAFFGMDADIALPGGITEGQVYFIKTAVGEVVTISASSGGAVIPIATSGAAICCQVLPFTITAGDFPAILANDAVLIER